MNNHHRAKPKERGIILDAAEVRGILEGRRSQLRRVIKTQTDWIRPVVGSDGVAHGYCGSGPDNGVRCPLGKPGDRLSVKETWATDERGEKMADGVVYRADGEFKAIDNTPESADLW